MSRALLQSSTTSSNLSPVDESSTDTANTSVSRIHSSATWSVPLRREANSIITRMVNHTRRLNLTLGERNRDCVGLQLLDGAYGDRDLSSPPQMTPFQNEVGDLLVVVDGEPANVANILPFARHDAAGAPELDFTFRDAVEDNADVLLDERRLEHSGSLEVGKCQHIRGPHVPIEICNGRLSEPEIREFVHARKGAELLPCTAQVDLGPPGRRVRALERYEQ